MNIWHRISAYLKVSYLTMWPLIPNNYLKLLPDDNESFVEESIKEINI